ncbi:hypothetical protein KM043_005566 [Ampulex compressa]|nr:hypothetical protein KM043_005566 [Ampulex compressa]
MVARTFPQGRTGCDSQLGANLRKSHLTRGRQQTNPEDRGRSPTENPFLEFNAPHFGPRRCALCGRVVTPLAAVCQGDSEDQRSGSREHGDPDTGRRVLSMKAVFPIGESQRN